MDQKFNASELKTMRKKLEKSLIDIRNDLTQLDSIQNMADDHFPDPFDRATMESDRNIDIRIKERENNLAHKIEKAIERIDNGNYQKCKICDDVIPKARLLARSVTDLCISCKEAQEQGERIS